MRRTRNREDVEEELTDITKVASQEGHLLDLLKPRIRPLLLIGIGLAVFQQIVGINTVIYYAPTILSFTGQHAGGALTQALFIGVTNVVFTIVAIVLIDTLGRRFFLILGTICLTLALVGLGFYFKVPYLQQNFHYMALACLLLYIAGFAIGLGPVFWLLISEIYPLRVRGSAMAVATLFNWAVNFGVSYTFLTLINTITKAGAFWFYADGCLRSGLLLVLCSRDQGQVPGGDRKVGPRRPRWDRGGLTKPHLMGRLPALHRQVAEFVDGLRAGSRPDGCEGLVRAGRAGVERFLVLLPTRVAIPKWVISSASPAMTR